ncbi:hypothetical protein Tco_0748539 [Tanacetum coccineum]|uniref:Uncharacterized protein n=1 Tax=Tanacetum coccineum TaxID=301880 RepID=A0ABQ4YZC5_9ASTR
MIRSFCEKFLQQKHAASIDQSPLQEMSLQEMEDLKQHYLDEMLSLSNDLGIKDYRNEKINIHFKRECKDMIDELKSKFNGMSIEINKKKDLQRLEPVANLSTYPLQRFKSFCYDDDDDYDYEEISIPLRDIISKLPSSIAITSVLPTLDPEDSLIMGNEELSTIPEKDSDKVIKSSVEDFVPIPSESEDTSGSDSECILPSCDDFSPINVYEETSVTLSNPLFNSNDDFTSSDDESLSDEDVPKDNVKIYSNPLFEFDDEYISSNVNPLFDEVLENIECKVSYDSNLDEPTLLVTPLSDFNEDVCLGLSDDIELLLYHDPCISVKIFYDAPIDDLIFDPGGDIDEIDTFLNVDISTDIEDGYHDSEGDILYLEHLLSDDTTLSLPPKVFLDHDPRSVFGLHKMRLAASLHLHGGGDTLILLWWMKMMRWWCASGWSSEHGRKGGDGGDVDGVDGPEMMVGNGVACSHAGDLEHNDWRRGRGYMIQGLRWICFDLRAWKDEIGERPQALEGSFPHYK